MDDDYKPPWGAGHLRRAVMHWLMWWRWRARLDCHQSRRCCQYVDEANCNNEGAPRYLRHRSGGGNSQGRWFEIMVGGRRWGKTSEHLKRVAREKRHRLSGL